VDPFHQEIAYISPPSIPPDPLVDGVEWMTTLFGRRHREVLIVSITVTMFGRRHGEVLVFRTRPAEEEESRANGRTKKKRPGPKKKRVSFGRSSV
jgi:hypothetical protein